MKILSQNECQMHFEYRKEHYYIDSYQKIYFSANDIEITDTIKDEILDLLKSHPDVCWRLEMHEGYMSDCDYSFEYFETHAQAMSAWTIGYFVFPVSKSSKNLI